MKGHVNEMIFQYQIPYEINSHIVFYTTVLYVPILIKILLILKYYFYIFIRRNLTNILYK